VSRKPATKQSATTKKKPAASSKTKAKKSSRKKARARVSPAKLRRLKQAFVASSTLKPMALQLIDLRSKPAYAGVELFARKHPSSDAGSLHGLRLGTPMFSTKSIRKPKTH